MSIFVVPDHAGVQNAHALRDGLLAALEKQDAVTLDLAGVAEADLSLLQLIEAARREAERRGKALSLVAPATGVVRATLARAGMATDPSDDAIAFWFHGDLEQ